MRGAVVALQLDNAGGSEVARKTQENGDVRATPGIDGLVFITHNTNVLIRAREEPHELILHAIGVLIFIDVEVLQACLPFFASGGRFTQQTRGPQEQIIEVQSLAVVQSFFISAENVSGLASILSKCFGADLLGSLTVILRVANAAQDITRSQFIGIDL